MQDTPTNSAPVVQPASSLPVELIESDPFPAKPWWQSKTIQGAIVIIGGLIAREALGDQRAPDEAQLAQAITLGTDLLGLLLVIIGRATASQPLK